VRAAIDHNGKIAAYEYHGWQHGWICAIARSIDTSAVPAAGVSSLTMVPTADGDVARSPKGPIGSGRATAAPSEALGAFRVEEGVGDRHRGRAHHLLPSHAD